MTATKLATYKQKRDFTRTAEPSGNDKVVASSALRFVIQKHAASHLHFDLRLEFDETFKSWAVPKGPSLDPNDRRLAMEVEDHPLDYGDFEGTIPEGQYGGGTVMLWDRGYWAPQPGFENIGRALGKGELKFVMEGQRMHGSWVLVRTRRDARGRASWILIKHRDEAAVAGNRGGPSDRDHSIASDRTMAQIAAGEGAAATPFMTLAGAAPGAVWRSNRADAAPAGQGEPAEPPPAARTAAALPEFIEPQLTRSVDKPPVGSEWVHEVKFDGYRMQLRVQDGRASLKTRKGLDWSDRYPEIVKAGRGLRQGVYDGEVVALWTRAARRISPPCRRPSPTDAPASWCSSCSTNCSMDWRICVRFPLSERKARLRSALADAPADIRFVDHFVTGGDAVLLSACRMHLEGIVSKRLDAPYQSGRAELVDQVQMPRRSRGGDRRLYHHQGRLPLADRRRQPGRRAGAGRPGRHRI